MKLDKILIARQEAILPEHVEHGDIIYDKRLVLSRTDNQCTVAFMEIPPGKSAYPRHYHFDITEVFYEESQNTPELRGVSALKHFAKTEAVGRAYLPDMMPPKIRLRLKRPPMSGKVARPTLAAYAKSICYKCRESSPLRGRLQAPCGGILKS